MPQRVRNDSQAAPSWRSNCRFRRNYSTREMILPSAHHRIDASQFNLFAKPSANDRYLRRAAVAARGGGGRSCEGEQARDDAWRQRTVSRASLARGEADDGGAGRKARPNPPLGGCEAQRSNAILMTGDNIEENEFIGEDHCPQRLCEKSACLKIKSARGRWCPKCGRDARSLYPPPEQLGV